MVAFPEDQIAELKQLCPNASSFEEGGATFFPLPGLNLPDGCAPAQVDALLCPSARDGYTSRLFFSERVGCNASPNWNATEVRIGEHNWHAYSWKTSTGLRLAQMVAAHLRGLR